MKVQNFTYNGFYGELEDGLTSYTAEFKEWTTDPGVGRFICSDGEERLIPTFALRGGDTNHLPPQPKTGVLFGTPCRS